MVTVEHVTKLKEAYKSNKEQLKELEQYINNNGITDDGLTDATESFEQGYNNALEYVFSILGIKCSITVEELKLKNGYEFECNMSNEYKDYKNHDEWGCAFIWFGENSEIGVEYNFCFDDGESCCAIYKMGLNEKTDYMETDYDTYVHYDIDFDNDNWKEELENAMCKALIEFHNL